MTDYPALRTKIRNLLLARFHGEHETADAVAGEVFALLVASFDPVLVPRAELIAIQAALADTTSRMLEMVLALTGPPPDPTKP